MAATWVKAKRIWEKNLGKEHVNYAVSLANLAKVYYKLGSIEKAEALFSESDLIWEKNFGNRNQNKISMLQSRAKLYQEYGHYDKAGIWLNKASLLTQEFVYDAVEYLSEQELFSYVSNFLANQNRSLSYVQYVHENTERQADSVYAIVFDNALLYKGLILNASHKMRHSAARDSISMDKHELLKAVHRSLANQYSRPKSERLNIDSLTEKLSVLQKDFARTVSGYSDILQKIYWNDVQLKLNKDEAAIEFVSYNYYNPYRTDSVMYAAIILRADRKYPSFTPLFEEKQLDSILNPNIDVQNYFNFLYNSKIDASILYRLIWQPIEGELKDIKKVYYSPSGYLHRINCNAIQMDNGKRLADKYLLTQLGSTRQLAKSENREPINGKAILYGGIHFDFDSTYTVHLKQANSTNIASHNNELNIAQNDFKLRGKHWNYLTWTRKEVFALSDIIEGANLTTMVFTGNYATEESVKEITRHPNISPRILHFATHGYFFPDMLDTKNSTEFDTLSGDAFIHSSHPMIRSGLLLAGANHTWKTGKPLRNNDEDGILTAYEISQLNLSYTELVVLSACETGLGDIQGNEGVYGLQRAFKIAGAKYLIMSLWQIPDRETTEFMVSFYKNWLQKKKSIPEAFRITQKEMRERFINPFSWAGFVLVE